MSDQEIEPTEAWEATILGGEDRKAGRPWVYDPVDPDALVERIVGYLNWSKRQVMYRHKVFANGNEGRERVKRYPSEGQAALYIGVSLSTWDNYKAVPEFKEVMEWACQAIREIQLEGAAVGFYAPAIVARHLGLKDKSEVDTNMNVTVIDNFSENETEE